MRCLVTGGAGYIGGHTVLALLDAGHQVVVLDDLSTGFEWSVPRPAELIVGDGGDFDLVSGILKTCDIDAVFHFAAKTIVPQSFEDPLGYYLNNSVKTRTLLAATTGARVSYFVFSSTAAVYAASEGLVSEQDRIDPLSPYGRSKYMSEGMVRDAAAAHDFRYAILRYFNVAGADPHGRHGQCTRDATHLIKVAIETALGKRPRMEMYGDDFPTPDGFAVRDYIHVSDLADAHLLALTLLQSGTPSFIANCGYGRGSSVKEVVDVVKAISGSDFEARTGPRRVGDLGSVVANSQKLRSLGWSPRFDDLSKIVAHAYQWEERLPMRLSEVRTDAGNRAARPASDLGPAMEIRPAHRAGPC